MLYILLNINHICELQKKLSFGLHTFLQLYNYKYVHVDLEWLKQTTTICIYCNKQVQTEVPVKDWEILKAILAFDLTC